MKAAPEAQKRLLDLAELDSVIDRLAHRRRTLPELAEIDERSKLFAKLATQVIEAETESGDLAREQAKAESDVDAVRTRADRDQKRLDSGAVTSPRDLSSLQSEITSLNKRQGDLEEVVLEIMERREAADAKAGDLV
ncbi:zinc ribbon domain-containing protein, partial [Nonomuraea sp. NPDC004297]